MNVSDELVERVLDVWINKPIMDAFNLPGSLRDRARAVIEVVRSALSVAAQDERSVVASGEQVVRCYGKTPEGHDCVSTYTAQAICDMGRAQTIRSCQNSLPASAIQTSTVGAQVRPLSEAVAPIAYCDPADIAEQSISFCGVWSAHLSINMRYTMPLYAHPPNGVVDQENGT